MQKSSPIPNLGATHRYAPISIFSRLDPRSWVGHGAYGYESDVYYLSPRALSVLQAGLPDAIWHDADLLVNWVRLVKSDAEIKMMQAAAKIAEVAMQSAWDGARPGVRQCDLMADIVAAQIRGTDEFGGDMTAIHPLILRARPRQPPIPCGQMRCWRTGRPSPLNWRMPKTL